MLGRVSWSCRTAYYLTHTLNPLLPLQVSIDYLEMPGILTAQPARYWRYTDGDEEGVQLFIGLGVLEHALVSL